MRATDETALQLCDDCGHDWNWCTCVCDGCAELVLDCTCDDTATPATEETQP